MKLVIVTAIVAVVFLAFMFAGTWIRRMRIKAIMARPFPEVWHRILKRTFPLYSRLPSELCRQLQAYTQVFMETKQFEGCGGLELTDEIRLTIAAQACVLLLNRRVSCYPNLTTVIVYPHTYVAGKKPVLGGDVEDESVRLGESWNTGQVVLSWDSVEGGAKNIYDGHNVTFHEFAHQLDQEDGVADGAPILPMPSAYATWARVLNNEYKILRRMIKRRKESLIDKYGGTNPAEFFAVATETFLEKPEQLLKSHPELYRELQNYYEMDPSTWR